MSRNDFLAIVGPKGICHQVSIGGRRKNRRDTLLSDHERVEFVTLAILIVRASLEMGAPILLGGMEFRVPATALVCLQAEARGLAILSEIAATLQASGYAPTKPKRGKADDVRLRCLHRLGYIHLILISKGACERNVGVQP